MKKKKKVKTKTPKTNPEITKFLHSFNLTNQKIDQRNFRATKIHMPRRPK